MSRKVFLSILALDSYQRGYAPGINGVTGTAIGTAVIKDVELPANAQAVGFFASAYQWQGDTILSYRGTDFDVGAGSFTTSEFVKELIRGWAFLVRR